MASGEIVIDHYRWLRTSLALVLLSVTLATTAQAVDQASVPAGAPEAVVEEFHVALLGIMHDAEELGFEGRCDRLAEAMDALFDTPFMAQKSVGRYWKTATPEERERLVGTFQRFSVSNYAGNFDSFNGETFETQDVVESTHGTKLVRTRLLAGDGEVVQLNYRLRPVDGQWKIIDVYLNGTVSELALRRSEYSSLIKREGFDSLLVALNEKIAVLATAGAPADQSP
jgi:phospholipid transport system substrate-binding protein